MAAIPLPVVTAETIETLCEGLRISVEPDVLHRYLEHLEKENPHLAHQVHQWATSLGMRYGAKDATELLMGPLLVYQLLRVQAQIDSNKI